jgi:hypothetical protein
VRFREKSGPFERVEDLLAIHGISARKLEQIRPYVTLSKPARRKPSSSSGSSIVSAWLFQVRNAGGCRAPA